MLDVLVDVRAGCRGLGNALDDVLKVFRPRVCELAVNELGAFLRDRVSVLEKELDQARSSNMAARDRLRLEQALEQLIVELDAAHGLIGLLESSVTGLPHSVEPLELMLQTYSTPPSGPARRLISTVVSGPAELQVSTRPRALAALIGAAVELLAKNHTGTPRVVFSGTSEAWSAELTVEEAPAGEPVTVWAHGVIPQTLLCLRAAAYCLGIQLNEDAEAARLSLVVKAK